MMNFIIFRFYNEKKKMTNLDQTQGLLKTIILNQRKDEIIDLCKVFNARAMLRLNRRSFEKVSLKTIQNIANSISNKEYSFCNKSYDRACGQGHIETKSKWIIDIDEIGRNTNDMILFIERNCDPIGDKFITTIQTKNGIHLITYPFNTSQFKEKYPEIEIHKDNPTNLYIP
jgi:hypothetical protein